MPVKKLREFLDKNGVKYVSIGHSPAYTAQEVAASAHIRGKDLAKIVMVKLDGRMAMAVVPSGYEVQFDSLKEAARVESAELATEAEFKDRFGDCEPGAMPPFGNLYDMQVFVEEHLAEDDEIAFNAGSHKELVKLAYKDFERLVKPTHARFAVKR